MDDVDCSSGTCLVDGLTAIMTVNFPGLTNVYTDVYLPDCFPGVAVGEKVDNVFSQNDIARITLLRKSYDVRIRNGVETLIVDDVDCSSGACLVDGMINVP